MAPWRGFRLCAAGASPLLWAQPACAGQDLAHLDIEDPMTLKIHE